MKKEYIAPKMEIVEMEHQDDLLLCLSNCEPDGNPDEMSVIED